MECSTSSSRDRHSSAGIMARDAEKKRLCNLRGISLLIVPFWWNGQLSSLASSILDLRPDLIHYVDKKFISSSIPNQIPERFTSILQINFLRLSSVPFAKSKAEEYTNQNVKNYVMMEKYNGIRVYLLGPVGLLKCYFDGHVLRSTKNKQILSFPSYLANQLPSVPFEAELWGNYSTWPILYYRLSQNEWEHIPHQLLQKNDTREKTKAGLILKVFDSADPKTFHMGYEERLNYLRQRILDIRSALLRYIFPICIGYKW